MGPTARIICGDAVEVLRRLPEGVAALTVTSPPYYRHRDYGVAGQIGQEPSLDGYLGRIASVLKGLLRVTAEDGSCFFVVGDTYRDRKLLLVPHRIAIQADALGWTVRNDVIWSKKDPAPESPRNRWRSSHEHVLFLTKRPTGYYFNADAVRVPYSLTTQRRWGSGQAYGGPKSRGRQAANDSRMRDGQTFRLHPKGCLPTDVWALPAANTSTRHYATFPQQLVRPVIEACSRPGGLVLDPFAGSGTTCALALSLGRRCLGIELNPAYAALADQAIRFTQPRAARNWFGKGWASKKVNSSVTAAVAPSVGC
jgi:site-specific DNA-methyltransferase (adenine-specific)